tara:strand:- start:2364 stop:2711 length:348 start_codon:yes stop_codon:yes gene_type:complete
MDLPTTAEKIIFEYLGFNLTMRRCMAETKNKKTCKLKKLRNGGLFCYVHEIKIKRGIAERICSSCELLGSKVRKKEEQNNYKEWKRRWYQATEKQRKFMRNKNWNYSYRNFFASY